jgi:transcriptional regulator with XRE-family HTH domain
LFHNKTALGGIEAMASRKLSSLGTLVRKKRGERKLRETARDVGIGPATLMRVENGRIPDIETFGKLCKWLGLDPGTFLGFDRQQTSRSSSATRPDTSISLSAHFRADQTPEPATVSALAKMILLAVKSQHGSEILEEDEHA